MYLFRYVVRMTFHPYQIYIALGTGSAHGDHTVFLGQVKSAVLHRDAAALELSSTGWQYGG